MLDVRSGPVMSSYMLLVNCHLFSTGMKLGTSCILQLVDTCCNPVKRETCVSTHERRAFGASIRTCLIASNLRFNCFSLFFTCYFRRLSVRWRQWLFGHGWGSNESGWMVVSSDGVIFVRQPRVRHFRTRRKYQWAAECRSDGRPLYKYFADRRSCLSIFFNVVCYISLK